MPRPSIVLSTLAMAAVLLPLSGSAGAGPDGVLPSSVTGFATMAGFVPPVLAVPTGTTVLFESLDFPHTFTEGWIVGSPSGPPCVQTPIGSTPKGARFDLATSGGAPVLTGTAGGRPTPTLVCTTATTADGAAVMRFYCAIHVWMVGELVVFDPTVTNEATVHTDLLELLAQDALSAQGAGSEPTSQSS